MPPLLRKKPVMGARKRMLPAARGRTLPARLRPRQGARPMQRPRQGARPMQMPRERPLSRQQMEPRISPAQRTGWRAIPLIGGFIDLIVNTIFRRQQSRTYKRAPVGSNAGTLITARIDMARKGVRPSYSKTSERTGARQVLRQQASRGRIPGVLKPGERKAA